MFSFIFLKSFYFSFFYHFFYHFIFHVFSFFFHFFHFFHFLSFFIIFASSGAKIFRKIKNCNFPRVFFIFLSFLLPVVELMKNDEKWKKNEKKMKKWKKNEKKRGKLQFSKKWKIAIFLGFFSFFFSFFYHFSSFLLPVVQKFSEK